MAKSRIETAIQTGKFRLMIIPFDKVSEFKQKLVLYYEDKDLISVKEFLKSSWVKNKGTITT